MPKVRYTVGKGLFQTSGNGINLDGIGEWAGQKAAVNSGGTITSATALVEGDSGKVFVLGGTALAGALALPAASATLPGWNITAYVTGAIDGDLTITRGSGDSSSTVTGSCSAASTSGHSAALVVGSNVVTFDQSAGPAAGDHVKITCVASTSSAAQFMVVGQSTK